MFCTREVNFMTNIKSGWKSSEFYVALAGLGSIVFTFVQVHCSVTQEDIIALLLSLVTAIYVGARTYLKSQVNNNSETSTQVTTVNSTPPVTPAPPTT
jgi:hypothetical protein